MAMTTSPPPITPAGPAAAANDVRPTAPSLPASIPPVTVTSASPPLPPVGARSMPATTATASRTAAGPDDTNGTGTSVKDVAAKGAASAASTATAAESPTASAARPTPTPAPAPAPSTPMPVPVPVPMPATLPTSTPSPPAPPPPSAPLPSMLSRVTGSKHVSFRLTREPAAAAAAPPQAVAAARRASEPSSPPPSAVLEARSTSLAAVGPSAPATVDRCPADRRPRIGPHANLIMAHEEEIGIPASPPASHDRMGSSASSASYSLHGSTSHLCIPDIIVYPPSEDPSCEPCISYNPHDGITGIDNPDACTQTSLYNAMFQVYAALPDVNEELPVASHDPAVRDWVDTTRYIHTQTTTTVPLSVIKWDLWKASTRRLMAADAAASSTLQPTTASTTMRTTESLPRQQSLSSSCASPTASSPTVVASAATSPSTSPSPSSHVPPLRYVLAALHQDVISRTLFGKRFAFDLLTCQNRVPTGEREAATYLRLDMSEWQADATVGLVPLLNHRLGHKAAEFFFGGSTARFAGTMRVQTPALPPKQVLINRLPGFVCILFDRPPVEALPPAPPAPLPTAAPVPPPPLPPRAPESTPQYAFKPGSIFASLNMPPLAAAASTPPPAFPLTPSPTTAAFPGAPARSNAPAPRAASSTAPSSPSAATDADYHPTNIELPMDLDLGCFAEARRDQKTFYGLHGFVTQSRGRFITYTRVRGDHHPWYKCRDGEVTTVELGHRVASRGVMLAIYRQIGS